MIITGSDLATLPETLHGELLAGIDALPADAFERAAGRWGRDALLRTLAFSEFARKALVADAEALLAESEHSPSQLLQVFTAELEACAEYDRAMQALRRFRRRFMLRLLLDEVAGHGDTQATIVCLSALADACIRIACDVSRCRLEYRFGTLRNGRGEAIPLVVVGMGKLGGHELNFSSDVDLVFLYPEAGCSDGRRSADAQEYCLRWSQLVVALLDEVTADGFVFRVDTRLRPFGDSGPPVCSYASLESYLLKHARPWERYAYVKARVCNLDDHHPAAMMLMQELVNPFVYRAYLDYGLLESLRDVHERIHAEQRGLDHNVKLGRGGIREVEFIVQSLQLLRGGRQPELKTQSLLDALRSAAGSAELPGDTADRLLEAYLFLRRVENLLQARADQQTHSLPVAESARAGLAVAMACADWTTLAAELAAHRRVVQAEFERVARKKQDSSSPALQALWESDSDLQHWQAALDGMADSERIAGMLVEFHDHVDRQRLEQTALERLAEFVPTLIDIAAGSDHPAVVVGRCLPILRQVLRRSAYIALLNENRAVAERLCRLVESSGYVVEQVSAFPALLDVLFDPREWSEPPSRDSLAAELEEALADIIADDSEALTEALARFQRSSLFRIAVAEISGALPLMKTSDSLSWLAEAVLEAALSIARSDLQRRHGRPCFRDDEGRDREAGFAVIAYGKLGGLELSYGSDLDLVFLHNSRGSRQQTSGHKCIENSVYFSRLARRLTHILTTQTRSGALYEIDTRLRPSGRSGMLVTSLAAFERYQHEDAWTWEHQALLRARPVAGDPALCARFAEVREHVLVNYVRRETLRDEVSGMRRRMRAELDRSGDDAFDLKHGSGGIGDLEFIVQYLALSAAAEHPSAVRFSDNIRQLDALCEAGVIAADEARELQDVYRRYRAELHRQVLDGADRMLPADSFREERAFVSGVWQRLFPGE